MQVILFVLRTIPVPIAFVAVAVVVINFTAWPFTQHNLSLGTRRCPPTIVFKGPLSQHSSLCPPISEPPWPFPLLLPCPRTPCRFSCPCRQRRCSPVRSARGDSPTYPMPSPSLNAKTTPCRCLAFVGLAEAGFFAVLDFLYFLELFAPDTASAARICFFFPVS